jgi:hypothetical protein
MKKYTAKNWSRDNAQWIEEGLWRHLYPDNAASCTDRRRDLLPNDLVADSDSK